MHGHQHPPLILRKDVQINFGFTFSFNPGSVKTKASKSIGGMSVLLLQTSKQRRERERDEKSGCLSRCLDVWLPELYTLVFTTHGV